MENNEVKTNSKVRDAFEMMLIVAAAMAFVYALHGKDKKAESDVKEKKIEPKQAVAPVSIMQPVVDNDRVYEYPAWKSEFFTFLKPQNQR